MNTFYVDVEILQNPIDIKKSSSKWVREIRKFSFFLKKERENVFNYKSF